MTANRFLYLILSCLFFLTACAVYDREVPVRDINAYQVGENLFYRVQRKDTLYSIAWQNEHDYRELAQLNHLKPPYTLHPNDRIQLTGHSTHITKPTYKKTTTNYRWNWPIRGKVIRSFSGANKGIDIAGPRDALVVAAASGKVVYAGNGIHGYNNLVIIKHDVNYLTAYGYNKSLLIHEGQWVKTKQPIAKIGTAPSGIFALHFEIRRNGKPVNPTRLLA